MLLPHAKTTPLRHDQCEMEYWLENSKVRRDDIKSQKIKHFFKPLKPMFKEDSHCLQEYFRKLTGREDI